MPTIRLSAQTLGSRVNGIYGVYSADSDGTIEVDVRDAAILVASGARYLHSGSGYYTTSKAAVVATLGYVVASGALTNGTITLASQPDIMRQVNVVWGAGTLAISAGAMAISYVANDGLSYIETVPLSLAVGSVSTYSLSRGVVIISPPVVTGLVGGASPFRRFDTTTAIAVPVDPTAQDYHTVAQAVDGAVETGGWSDSAVTVGCVAPNTPTNGTHQFSFFYNFVAPVI